MQLEREITLTAKELFFLGKCMDAKYIDYAYVAAIPDIQKRFSLHEQQALEALEDMGVIEEDFSGNVEVADEMRELFEPVFFGDTESRLDNGTDFRIHVLDGKMTLGKIEGEQITFSELSESELEELLSGDARVQCSRAYDGFCEKNFTGEQLMDPDTRKEAMKILKGEVEYGVS